MNTNLSTCNIEELNKKIKNLLFHVKLIEREIAKKMIDDPMIIDNIDNRQIVNIPIPETQPTTSLKIASINKINITPKKKII